MQSRLNDLLEKRGYGYGLLAGLMAAVLLVLMARALIDHAPLYDELLHVLAARGILEHGEPVIADGEYTRAWVFTNLVAVAFSMAGDALVVARAPALAAAACLLIVLSVWVTRRAGLLAGAASAVVACLMPVTVELAVFARFYTLHALTILSIGVLFYEASAASRLVSRLLLTALGIVLAVLAWHLQDSTLIGVGALACGVAAVLIFDRWNDVFAFVRRYPLRIGVALAALLIVGLVGVAQVGLLEKMGEAPLWNEWAAGRPHYYFMALAGQLPLLWPLFPVAVVLAVSVCPRLAIFSAAVLVAGLAVHSIAAAKSLRYIYYLLPFFCIVWGCALSAIFAWVRRAWVRSGETTGRGTGYLAMVLAILVLAGSSEGQGAAKLIAGKVDLRAFGFDAFSEPDWIPVLSTLRPLSDGSERVVTSNAMKALYYLGQYNYELNASIVPETETGEEFGRDIRTGGLAISTAGSIDEVLAKPGRTLVVLEDKKIANKVGVTQGAVDVITARCTPIALTADVKIHAWSCSN